MDCSSRQPAQLVGDEVVAGHVVVTDHLSVD